jgi:hypothetical protein
MAEEERIKKIVKLRNVLEKRLEETKVELEGLLALLEFTDSVLLEGGFKRAKLPETLPSSPSEIEQTASAPLPSRAATAIPIKTVSGELLATLYTVEDSVRIVPAEEKDFNTKTPPFKPFFLEGVLDKMLEKDREAVERGEIPPEKMFSYDVVVDGDLIREINVENVTPNRSREIKSAVRWTLEKMYEKTG